MNHRGVSVVVSSDAMDEVCLRSWTVVAVMSTFLLLLASPAWAGGSWLDADRSVAHPGDEIVVGGVVYRGQLGWLGHGPFVLTLRPVSTEASGRGRVPSDVVVGEFETEPVGSHAVEIRVVFRVPNLEPGSYSYGYCNDPCTTGLGDLMGVRATLEVVAAAETLPRTGPPLAVGWLVAASLLSAAAGSAALGCGRAARRHRLRRDARSLL